MTATRETIDIVRTVARGDRLEYAGKVYVFGVGRDGVVRKYSKGR